MAVKSRFVCSNCENVEPKWLGRCPACDTWDSLVEQAAPAAAAGAGKGQGRAIAKTGAASTAVPASVRKLNDHTASDHPRFTTHISEFDEVLGGGVVPGSAILVAAEPGAGKSTLCSQACDNLCGSGKKVLWVAGEESPSQIRLRTDRMGLKNGDKLDIATETEVGAICARIAGEGYDFVVVDSINCIYDAERDGLPGSTSIVKETAMALIRTAKESGAAVLIIAHVTKDGTMGGPKHMEHMADAVLVLEGERTQHVRVLRALKNRFGSTNEVGVFEMTGAGMLPVADPTAVFLADRSEQVAGAVVCPVVEGSRPILVEVQALAAPTHLPTPMRRAQGIDKNRLDMMLAILQTRAGMNLKLGTKDIYVQISGGMPVKEPAIDLAVCIAVASAASKQPVLKDLACFGEVSLLGEVRPVNNADSRTNAAAKLGSGKVLAGRRQGNISVTSLKDALAAALAPVTADVRDEKDAEEAEAREAREERVAASRAMQPA